MTPRPPFPVIVGVPRSGTTLLRLMLDAHTNLAIPPETGFLMSASMASAERSSVQIARELIAFPEQAPAWADFGLDPAEFMKYIGSLPKDAGPSGVLRAFYDLYSKRFGKQRGGDKTPLYLLHMLRLASVLPEAHFIHLIRDGRDVALSWRQTWFAPSKDIPTLVRHWAEMIQSAREHSRGLHYLEIRYEDLIRFPAETLGKICRFIELDYQPAMLQYYQSAPHRLQEHLARYATDGTLLVSQETRLQQQRKTREPPDPGRIGAWQGQLSQEEMASCEWLVRLGLNG